MWVKATAEDGTWGLGECYFGAPVAALIDHCYAPLLEGRDCMALELLNDLMWRGSQQFGATGIASVARSGVDLALWDLKGKLLGQPVYSLLGGPCRDKVPLYATSDDLEWSMELGFKSFKISNPVQYVMGLDGLNILGGDGRKGARNGRARRGADVQPGDVLQRGVHAQTRGASKAVRPAVGSEEPLVPGDLEGHIELKKAITWVPIATGEHHHGRHAFRQLVENRAVDVVQPDLNWCGGLSEAVKIYTIAEAAGIVTVPHTGGRQGLRPALCDGDARVAYGGVLDGLGPRRSTGGGPAHPGSFGAQRRLRRAVRRTRLRHGGVRGVDQPLGPLRTPARRLVVPTELHRRLV